MDVTWWYGSRLSAVSDSGHGHQAYITFTTHTPKIVKEFSIDLQSTEAAHGVAISEATPYGYYEDIDLIKDAAARESRRLQVHTLLQDALATLREPTAIRDEQIFAAMIIDMALDAHTATLNIDSVNDVVADILSSYGDDLGQLTGSSTSMRYEKGLPSVLKTLRQPNK